MNSARTQAMVRILVTGFGLIALAHTALAVDPLPPMLENASPEEQLAYREREARKGLKEKLEVGQLRFQEREQHRQDLVTAVNMQAESRRLELENERAILNPPPHEFVGPHPVVVILSIIVSVFALGHAGWQAVKRARQRRERMRRWKELQATASRPMESAGAHEANIPDVAIPAVPKHELHPDNVARQKEEQGQAEREERSLQERIKRQVLWQMADGTENPETSPKPKADPNRVTIVLDENAEDFDLDKQVEEILRQRPREEPQRVSWWH